MAEPATSDGVVTRTQDSRLFGPRPAGGRERAAWPEATPYNGGRVRDDRHYADA
jgi:hypothetical protein